MNSTKLYICFSVLFAVSCKLIFAAQFDVAAPADESLQSRYKHFFQREHIEFGSFGVKEQTEEFLIANERSPINIEPHLNFPENKKTGNLFCAGSERAFSAVALCSNCTGLIGRDINPRIKAYNDFNLLLIILATNREDYVKFRDVEKIVKYNKGRELFLKEAIRSGITLGEYMKLANGISGRDVLEFSPLLVAQIREKLHESNLDKEIKEYYIINFDNLAEIFFSVQLSYSALDLLDKDSAYSQSASYLWDDILFNRIKNLASAGNIIFTIGDINNLREFSKEEILAIDISNIPDYAVLTYEHNTQIAGKNIRVIWTRAGDLHNTRYFSYVPQYSCSSDFWTNSKKLEQLLTKSGVSLTHIFSELADAEPFCALPLGINILAGQDSNFSHLIPAVEKYLVRHAK